MFFSFPCSRHVQSININRVSGIEFLLPTENTSFGERSYCLNVFAFINFLKIMLCKQCLGKSVLTMVHPSIRFSGSRMEGKSSIRGESIVGEAIPWNGRCNKWNLMTIFKKRPQQTSVSLRQVSAGSGVPDRLLLLWVSKTHHITGGSGIMNIPSRLSAWPLGQKPGSGQCAGAHIWGLPLLHGGESWTARGCHPDSDWLTQDSGLTSGEKKLSQTKYISWPLNRNTPPLITLMHVLAEA